MKRFKISEACNNAAALIGKQIQGCETLDDVAESLASESSHFHEWFIYKGGSHVSVHTHEGTPRIAIITKA